MPLLRSLPEQPVMRDLYKSQPTSCKPLGELTEVAMRGPSPFTQGERELIVAYVSGLNACKYCHATHAGVAAAFGKPLPALTMYAARIGQCSRLQRLVREALLRAGARWWVCRSANAAMWALYKSGVPFRTIIYEDGTTER